VIGVVAAAFDCLPNDTGAGVLWFVAVGLLVFPLGTLFSVAAIVVLGIIEHATLGPETHFAPLAQVAFFWSAAVSGGVLQGVAFRRWRAARRGDRNAI
jgi:hypothetical protein